MTPRAGPADSPVNGARVRTPELLRPVGRSRWGMGAALAVGLGVILCGTALSGRAEWGSAIGLGFVLTAVPEIPTAWRPALHTMAVRAATVMVAGTLVVSMHNAVVLATLTIAASIVGALVPGVGATAGLAVVLISIDLDRDATGPTALWPYLVGIVIVFAGWAVWFAASRVRNRGEDEPTSSSAPAGAAHAVRVGVAVGLAVLMATLLPAGMVGGHWLVTSVLLTIQPTQSRTGQRLAQRLSGNAVGAVIAAALLGAHPPAPVVIGLTVVLFLLAMALRPVNYTWWAITGPPVLLVISEYPGLFPWYEGAVRLAMNFAGALIVVLIVFVAPLAAPMRLRQR